jgi:3-phenylpropionate/cinnamic acid dioxygenase small subunit
MNDLNAVADKDAIRELLARYCFLLDGYKLKEFAALFTADGEWISRNGQAAGPEAIERLLRGLVPEPAPGKRRKHFTTNILVDLAGDSATVVSNFLVVRDSAAGPVIAVAGTYDDTVVRTNEGWKFKSRRLSHDIAGESGLNVGLG